MPSLPELLDRVFINVNLIVHLKFVSNRSMHASD